MVSPFSHLLWYVRPEVDRECQSGIKGLHQVTQLLGALQLEVAVREKRREDKRQKREEEERWTYVCACVCACVCLQTFSSLSHFSSSCFLPCCSTGRHSSSASYLFSWALSEVDLSRSRLKYCSTGAVWPGCVGACWKRWMVSGVRRIPYGCACGGERRVWSLYVRTYVRTSLLAVGRVNMVVVQLSCSGSCIV